MKNKAVNANGSYIDFRDHISRDANLVSGTFLLLQSPTCITTVSNGSFHFCEINDLDDVTSVKWPRTTDVSNSTCVMEESGFLDEVIYVERVPLQDLVHRNLMAEWGDILSRADVPKRDISRVPVPQTTNNKTVPFHVEEIWCSNYRKKSCAGSLKIAGGFGELTFRGGVEAIPSTYRTKKRQDSEILKSRAFLTDILNLEGVAKSRRMALSRIETNALVRKYAGRRNVTDINVALVAATFGTAVVITFLTGLLACTGWTLYVAKPGRRNYNMFNSASDAMACASFVMFRDEGCSLPGRNSGIFLKATDGFVRPEMRLTNGKEMNRNSDSTT